MLATGQLGVILVSAREVAEGMRLLDEATAAAVRGELRDGENTAREQSSESTHSTGH